MANKPSTPSSDVTSVLKKMGNVKIEGKDKNKNNTPEETTLAGSLINELKELFSDRINIIILAGVIALSSGGVALAVYYEKNKTSQKPIAEEDIPQRRIKKVVSEEIVVEEKKEVQKQTPEKQEPIKNEDAKKQALREEVLNTGTASISGPDDVKNIVDLINEMNKTEKRK